MKKRIIPLLTFVIIFSCFKKSEGLKQTEIPGLMNQFMYMHVQYHEFNDELSARPLDNYIMLLDYGKYHFYKEDVEKFQKYRTQLDDLAASDNFDAVFEIFMVFKKRFKENMDLVNELMKLPYDFNVDEKINVDRDTVDYARDRNEMKERWRKSIKLQLLNYMSAGKDLDYAKKKLLKKYELSEKRTDEISNEDILSRFMNAWSMALDPHSNYLTQDENQDFKIAMVLKLEGIGVRLKSEDGFVIVESIIPGGATDKLPDSIRLKPSDKIVAVSQGASGEWTDVIDMDLRDVVSKIRGKKGSEVRLTIMRETAESDKPLRMVVPIIREEIQLQDSDAKSEVYAMNSGDRNARIGYLNLPSFYQDAEDGKTSAGDIRIQLESLTKKGIDALVLDLRGNPGGLLTKPLI
jgi:carboxyl-terminal processing protease